MLLKVGEVPSSGKYKEPARTLFLSINMRVRKETAIDPHIRHATENFDRGRFRGCATFSLCPMPDAAGIRQAIPRLAPLE